MRDTKRSIKKDMLTFTALFIWLLFRHFLTPIGAHNIISWGRSMLMTAMIFGFEVDFTWLFKGVMHGRAFKDTTSYPF